LVGNPLVLQNDRCRLRGDGYRRSDRSRTGTRRQRATGRARRNTRRSSTCDRRYSGEWKLSLIGGWAGLEPAVERFLVMVMG